MQFPPAFENRMHGKLGNQWSDFEKVHEEPSPVSIRFNPKKQFHPTDLSPIPWTSAGYYLKERPSFTLDPALHGGAYYVQEASSMFLEQALKQAIDLTQPLRVLDLCAAPGGKSTHLLSLLNKKSLLVSNEVIRSRASILSENIQKWGHPNVVVTNNDPDNFKRLKGFFDVIVVDAPCSGEGLFRKDHEAMNEWSPENANLCSQRQQRILADVWPALKEGGLLIYCTCTFNEEENENNLLRWSKEHPVEFVDLALDASWGIETIKKENVIGYQCYPHRVKGEGFFISAFKKKEEENPSSISTKQNFQRAGKKTVEKIQDWFGNTADYSFLVQDDLLIMIPERQYQEIEFISHYLKVVTKGTAIAAIKHEKLVPEHALALSIDLNKAAFKEIALDLPQALAYLRKENLVVGEGERGFALVSYQGVPLGWVNLLGNRLNNNYPSNWRIRMS
jgi:16S rRNA C967 or C1407 C5-methylase (RsmB/RsmF family)/NOL1/NOP2/fmu family ribosome biogenesis protein